MTLGTQRMTVDISLRSIVKIIIVLLGIALVYIVRDVLILFFVVLVLYAALNPIIDKWEQEISRKMAVSLLFIILILFGIAVGLLIIPPIVLQIQELSSRIPDFIKNLASSINISSNIIKQSQDQLLSASGTIGKFGQTIFNTTIGFLGGIVAVVTIFVCTYYLMLEKNRTKKFFESLPLDHKEVYIELFEKISIKMGSWLRGQMTILLFVGCADLVVLLVGGIPYALALAVWAGLCEIIPFVGSILGMIPAILVALSLSPLKGLIVFIFLLLIQQVQSQYVVPKVMGKAVGLSPVVIIFAILVGAKLMGVMGVILAVPAAAILSVIIQEYPIWKRAMNQ